jgi:uncharacterized phage-associated protein
MLSLALYCAALLDSAWQAIDALTTHGEGGNPWLEGPPMPYKAKSVANAFLTLANRDGRPIDPMKLQKLMYYANGYFIAENEGNPLINEYFEAWDYGPVVPTVYYEFREYKERPIRRFAYTWDRKLGRTVIAPQPVNDVPAESVIAWVWENYGDFSGLDLSAMTHKEGTPWSDARRRAANSGMRNERLELQETKRYFEALAD